LPGLEEMLKLNIEERPRVLLLTQWFDPEPTFKGIVFARELTTHGFDVEVVTGFPNYPGGKLYPGYKIKWFQREFIDGVQITRLPLYPSHDQSAVKRVLNYVSFATSSLIYCLFVAKRANVIYAYHPPLTTGITACIVRCIRRIPVVYDIQDMWPDTLRATGMLNSTRLLRVVGSVCNWVYKKVDRIVVLSPGFRHLLLERGVPDAKLSVVYNWADQASLTAPRGGVPAMFSDPGRFRILFAGNMGKAQALDTVLEAAELLQKRGSRVCWMMLGRGVEVERLKAEAARRQLSNVVFLPAVPMDEVGAYLQGADALLVHLRKDPLFQITIPSKTQAYMAAGKPLLMAVDGDAATLVREANCGRIAKSEDGEDLAQVAAAFSNMTEEELNLLGDNAKGYYQKYLSLSVGVRNFADLFKQTNTGYPPNA
jgi:colanic acid biosynthesis glycosyl transferase WcaI